MAKKKPAVKRESQITRFLEDEIRIDERGTKKKQIYAGISRDPEGARYQIDLPSSVSEVGPLYADDAVVGREVARRYVAEKLFMGISPRAIEIKK